MKNKALKGFTLIELLIVIGIIAILAGIVLVAVNPAEQFGKANDSERKSELSALLSAVYQFGTSPSNRGALPTCPINGVDSAIPLCDGLDDDLFDPTAVAAYDSAIQLGTTVDVNHMDCSGVLVPSYIRDIPVDPTNTYDAADTGYYICRSGTPVDVVYVLAPGAEVFTTAADGGCRVPATSPLDNDDDAYTMCTSA